MIETTYRSKQREQQTIYLHLPPYLYTAAVSESGADLSSETHGKAWLQSQIDV